MAENLRKTLSGLKKSEDNYRGIFENSIEGILQTSIEGKVLNANPAIAGILRCGDPERVKNFYTDLKTQLYVNPEERNEIVSQLMEKGEIREREIHFYRCDGGKMWISLNAYLVRDASGEPLRIEALLSDISDRKRAEHEKEKLFQQLARAQKLDAVGKLAGGVAHDFNNMLAVILGHTQLALIKTKPGDLFYRTFQEIQKAAEHSANLTRQLLGFARKQTVAPRAIDLNETINGTFSLLRRLIREDIELLFMPEDGIWPVFMDHDQVGQILTNLCVNARDAIEGNGSIVIKTQNASFDAEYREYFPDCKPGDYVCLSVSDNGAGMDRETQGHIFEPFFTTKPVSEGTGLGLSTVYGIVRQNNAFVNVYSEPGQGATFNVYFPRYAGDDASEDGGEAQQPIVLDMGTVLLVEDEQRLLEITAKMLEQMGCNVLTLTSPAKAIEAAKERSNIIDLLITDVVMPGMNGRELSERIREIRPDLPCLFMSGYTADIIGNRGILDTGIDFIQKPFSLQTLAEKIRQVMAR